MPTLPTLPSQPLEYSDALVAATSGPSTCGGTSSPLAQRAYHRMAHTLRGNHEPLEILAFGGSVTHGDEWQGVIDGNVFPRVLARELVSRGVARSARVRNLAIGATHGAAPHALCCETLITENSAVRTLDLARNYDKRRFPWMVNGTFTGYAFSQQAAVAGDSPPPIVLLEFGVNGVSWVDVLLRRLRARWPRAILVYVDLTSLYSWRKSAGWPQDFVWNEAWEKAPTCTTQMQGWLQSTGTEFWSMRSELRRRGVSYGKATGVYYFGDKKHLKQAGHTMIGKGVADLVEAGIRLAKQQGRSSSSVDEVHQGRAAAAAMARQQHTNELCFLWYRSGLIDPRLRVRMLNGGADGVGSTPAGVVGGGGRSFATRLTAASSAARDDDWRFDDFSRRARMRGELGTREEGKFAFLLDSARNATPLGRATATSALSLAFETRVNHSAVFAAFMLDCCIYGSARATLDGKPFGPTLHGSSPGFQHHVLHAQRLGSVEQAGHHRLTVRLVRASPTGAQRFRLGGLFVVPEPASGRDYETEYVWIVPRYAKEGA